MKEITIEDFNKWHALHGEDYIDQNKCPISVSFFLGWLSIKNPQLAQRALEFREADRQNAIKRNWTTWIFDFNLLVDTDEPVFCDFYLHSHMADEEPCQELYILLAEIANVNEFVNERFWKSLVS